MTESIKAVTDEERGIFDVKRFMGQYGVENEKVTPIVECLLDKRGEVSITCLLHGHTLLHTGRGVSMHGT